jgi:hypothetical protein
MSLAAILDAARRKTQGRGDFEAPSRCRRVNKYRPLGEQFAPGLELQPVRSGPHPGRLPDWPASGHFFPAFRFAGFATGSPATSSENAEQSTPRAAASFTTVDH